MDPLGCDERYPQSLRGVIAKDARQERHEAVKKTRMTTLHKQHLVRARVLTGAGWLEGTFHLAQLHGFAQYLSKNAWYPLTDVTLANVGALPFFQLSRSETLLVVVAPSTRPHPTSVGVRPQGATFVLGPASVDGTVQVPARLRLSDFIDNSTGFIHVQRSSVKGPAGSRVERFEDLLLNPQRLVGVMESHEAACLLRTGTD